MASAGQDKSGIPRLEAVARFVLVLVLLLVTHWRRPYAGPCRWVLESTRAEEHHASPDFCRYGRTHFLYPLPLPPGPHSQQAGGVCLRFKPVDRQVMCDYCPVMHAISLSAQPSAGRFSLNTSCKSLLEQMSSLHLTLRFPTVRALMH